LRKICGPTKENGQWRIKPNTELINKYKSQDIVTVIKIRRLEWLGHVIRVNETRSVKKILEGRRGRGRPTFRWINDVEDDLRKLRERERERVGVCGGGGVCVGFFVYIYIHIYTHEKGGKKTSFE